MSAEREFGFLISAAFHVLALGMAVQLETRHRTPGEPESLDVHQAVATGTVNRERINTALDRDKDRWLASSSVRLQRFGYRFDTF